ncbi:hypothetical protein SODALDRAFT_329250 [Sodiomyces alkalinus F11]|uniref:Uncharacterized protein n=1 Tax=Sodiomyces alkalinus (strain CBS 110278 / VKM F-3762 / F11) TaxID=1314773 RepID=A0A3N2PKI4_SODAK|nr:hypothetical protein SODALDRAFT_329250 [Sodiomyces alkalinus F11]ROT35052.1 hypothetical protein SODALDRAFT_329250 [Sodiomyces alkalinus F11]
MELSKMFLWASLALTTTALPRAEGVNGDGIAEKKDNSAVRFTISEDGIPIIVNPVFAMATLSTQPASALHLNTTDPATLESILPAPKSTTRAHGNENNDGAFGPRNGLFHNPCDTARCGDGTTCIVAQGRPKCVSGATCGPAVCGRGTVCCNHSCGICTPPDGFCIQMLCGS